jgi:nucleotide-binding universal stress UspA family protein
MFKNILLPTDFSDVAGNALRYALELARVVGIQKVDVKHWYTPQTAPDAMLIPPVQEVLRQRQDSMDHFLAEIKADPDIELTNSIEIGFAADGIVDFSTDYDLVIMGATGENGLLERVFGSVSSAVSQRAAAPVLLVPGTAAFVNFRQILYASHDISLSHTLVGQLMDFNQLFHARVHFINVQDPEEETSREDRERLFATLFTGPDPDFAFEIADVAAGTVEEGLRSYVQNHPIDLVVMATRRRGFWEGFFHRSQVKRMALHPDLPLLIFHM